MRAAEVLRGDSGGLARDRAREEYPQKRMPPRRPRLGGIAVPLSRFGSAERTFGARRLPEARRGAIVSDASAAGRTSQPRSQLVRVHGLSGRVAGPTDAERSEPLIFGVDDRHRGVRDPPGRAGRSWRRRSSCATTCSASSRACPSATSSTAATPRASTWSPCATGELLATCRILLVGSTAQFSRLAVRALGAPAGDRHRAARPPPTSEIARRRGAADRAPRPDLRPGAVRDGRLPAARAGVLGGRDRAHRDGEAARLRAPIA